MRVRFWGTRGSIATPGPGTNYFGGNTSCVELTTANGDLLIFDCGTGAHGPVDGVVGIEGGVVSGVINLESSGVGASDWRPRHGKHYQEV
jgi:hypothetical protein